MLNRSTSLAMSTRVLKVLPGKLDIKRHSPSILYIYIYVARFKVNLINLVEHKHMYTVRYVLYIRLQTRRL